MAGLEAMSRESAARRSRSRPPSSRPPRQRSPASRFSRARRPLDALRALAEGAVGSRAALGETLARATALVLTAVGACLAFRAGVLNIGLEGQFLAGAVAAAAVGPLFPGRPLAARVGASRRRGARRSALGRCRPPTSRRDAACRKCSRRSS